MAGLGFETIDAAAADTVAEAKRLTDGRGADIAVEATGFPPALVQAIEAAGSLGQVVLLGDLSGDLTLNQKTVSSILRRELRLYGTWNAKVTPVGQSEWDMVIHHLDRDLQVEPLISHVRRLEEAPATFGQLRDRTIWYNKVLFAIADEALDEIVER
jgi:L-iditol 2-dehydrogenase/galactitol-1-phosphate 5-dehydrogenase